MKMSLVALTACCVISSNAFAVTDSAGAMPPRLVLADSAGAMPPRLVLVDSAGAMPPR